MGNRLSSGNTGSFNVEVFEYASASTIEDGEDQTPLSVGTAVYTMAGGEYRGMYNVTASGDYALHVRYMENLGRGTLFVGARQATLKLRNTAETLSKQPSSDSSGCHVSIDLPTN